jgi:hypothetical protein
MFFYFYKQFKLKLIEIKNFGHSKKNHECLTNSKSFFLFFQNIYN